MIFRTECNVQHTNSCLQQALRLQEAALGAFSKTSPHSSAKCVRNTGWIFRRFLHSAFVTYLTVTSERANVSVILESNSEKFYHFSSNLQEAIFFLVYSMLWMYYFNIHSLKYAIQHFLFTKLCRIYKVCVSYYEQY